jgi:hypothetical protein
MELSKLPCTIATGLPIHAIEPALAGDLLNPALELRALHELCERNSDGLRVVRGSDRTTGSRDELRIYSETSCPSRS